MLMMSKGESQVGKKGGGTFSSTRDDYQGQSGPSWRQVKQKFRWRGGDQVVSAAFERSLTVPSSSIVACVVRTCMRNNMT